MVNVYASQAGQRRPARPSRAIPSSSSSSAARCAPRAQNSLGSGVLVDPSGVVVTNFHVIRDADEVKVALADGREFTSKVLLKDESLDLAILKIDSPEPFPVLPIGDSDALQIGDLVLAIGNPFGVGQTTTSGIVSALARSHVGVSDFGFFIQTDAAINPGNSGGALINMAGQLVGINTAIFSRSGGSIGIGFAIPSNMVRAVVEAARRRQRLLRAPLCRRDLRGGDGRRSPSRSAWRARPARCVSRSSPDGPADKAGSKPGDVVLALNGAPIEHVDALGYRLATAGASAAPPSSRS